LRLLQLLCSIGFGLSSFLLSSLLICLGLPCGFVEHIAMAALSILQRFLERFRLQAAKVNS